MDGYRYQATVVPRGSSRWARLYLTPSRNCIHSICMANTELRASDGAFQPNMGTLYLNLMRLEQRGLVRARWGTSDNNRRALFHSLSVAWRRALKGENGDWGRITPVMQVLLNQQP
jgi:PadR family transcriptional regulator